MNAVDFVILGILLISTGISFLRGFMREILSLAAWIAAVWIALVFTPQLSTLLTDQIDNESARLLVSCCFVYCDVDCRRISQFFYRSTGEEDRLQWYRSHDRIAFRTGQRWGYCSGFNLCSWLNPGAQRILVERFNFSASFPATGRLAG